MNENVWERQTGSDGKREPALWFSRFERYLSLGPKRSVLAVYNEWREKARKGATKSVPGSWQKNSKKWRWQERAEAFDAHVAEQARAERAERERRLREEAQQIRRNLLGVGNNLLAKTMLLYMGKDGATPDAQTVQRLMNAIVKFNEDSRAEYGDLPVQAVDLTSKGERVMPQVTMYLPDNGRDT